MTDREKIDFISEALDVTESLIQLAEECSELSAMAAKYIRSLNGRNPTPLNSDQIMERITEEFSDVKLCVDVLENRLPYGSIYRRKLDRWVNRLKAKHGG